MSLQDPSRTGDAAILAEIKTISGKRIEERRRLMRMTQEKLAADVGIGVRWLREIETGNPITRIDDHLRCAHGLGLSTGYIVIPLMFMEHDIAFPSQLLTSDLAELERGCIQFIADYNLDRLARQMRGVRRDTPDSDR